MHATPLTLHIPHNHQRVLSHEPPALPAARSLPGSSQALLAWHCPWLHPELPHPAPCRLSCVRQGSWHLLCLSLSKGPFAWLAPSQPALAQISPPLKGVSGTTGLGHHPPLGCSIFLSASSFCLLVSPMEAGHLASSKWCWESGCVLLVCSTGQLQTLRAV
jgi:hypothetical protein